MDVFQGMLAKVVDEIKEQTGENVDVGKKSYVLQTPSAHVFLNLEDDDDGGRKLNFEVVGGELTYVQTDNDIFDNLYNTQEDEEHE